MESDKIEIIVEDREEYPSDARRRVKVLEMPVFDYEDKRRIEKIISKIEELSEAVGSYRPDDTEVSKKLDKMLQLMSNGKETAALIDVRDNLNILASSVHTNEERIVSFLGRTVENIESINRTISNLRSEISEMSVPESRLNATESRLEEKLYALDSTVNYLKGLLLELSERTAAVSDAVDSRVNALVENVSEKFDAHTANLNNRLDNMSLQVIEPLSDISLRVDDAINNRLNSAVMEIKDSVAENVGDVSKQLKGVEKLPSVVESAKADLDDKIADLKAISENYSIMVDRLEEFRTVLEKTGKSTAKKIDAAAKDAAAYERSLRKSIDDIKTKDTEVKSLLNDVRRINTRLAKMDDLEFLLRIIDARKKVVRYKLPKLVRADRKRLLAALNALEDEVLDLSIIATLGKKKLTVPQIRKTVVVSESKLRKRIKLLVANGKLTRERSGRSVVYSVVAG